MSRLRAWERQHRRCLPRHTNTLDEEAAQAAYDRYQAPTPAKVLFQGGFAAVTPHASTTFNYADDDRAPLLFISGGSDHILPPVIQRHNYDKKRQALHRDRRAQGVPRPGPLHLRGTRLGSRRRLRPGLGPHPGRGRARLTSADGQRPAVPRSAAVPGNRVTAANERSQISRSRAELILAAHRSGHGGIEWFFRSYEADRRIEALGAQGFPTAAVPRPRSACVSIESFMTRAG